MFTALQNLNDTDIRGLGYTYDGLALTSDQSVGQHTSYLGSSVVGTLSTNKASGNDVIYAGAGDDMAVGYAGNDMISGDDITQFNSGTREQRHCYKKHSSWRNRYAVYRPIFHIRKSVSQRCMPSLASRSSTVFVAPVMNSSRSRAHDFVHFNLTVGSNQ